MPVSGQQDELQPLHSGTVVARRGTPPNARRRPASVVIHDNEELLRLADQLHSQEALEQSKSASATNLVRRNSSGYSSSGSRDRLAKTAAADAKVSQASQSVPKVPTPNSSRRYKGAATVAGAESKLDPRRSSMMARVGEFRPRASVTLTSRSSGSLPPGQNGGQGRVADGGKKHLLGGGGGGKKSPEVRAKVTYRQKSHEQHAAVSDAKRAAFLQNRSSTGLNLFGLGHKRRSSVAAGHADDAALAGMRPARSSTNLGQHPGSPALSKKRTPQAAAGEHKKSSRFSFHQRSWTDIEKLWRGRVREPPNIEAMIKPKSSFGNADPGNDKTPTKACRGLGLPPRVD